VGLSILFTKFFNVVGPLLGTLVSFLAVNLWWLPILLRERFGMSIRSLIESATRPLLIGVPYAAGVWWLAQRHPPRGWAWLVVSMLLTSAGYLAVWWLLLLSARERAVWRGRASALFARAS